MRNVLVAGAGAIGVAIGASLASQGIKVTFYARSKTRQAIEQGGVKRTGLFGEIDIPAGAVSSVGSLAELEENSIDLVVVCTKTLANQEMASLLWENREKLTDEAQIVILQNGWGNDVPYLRYFPAERIYQARVITGFARTEPNVSNVTVHTAPILLGSLHGCDVSCLEPLAAAISASGIPSETTLELSEALWAKMLYNTTLNPLGAILGVSYGKLADCPDSREIMNQLIDETFAVMDAHGFKTFWKNADEYRQAFYGKLVPDTYGHRSSTLQDIEKKQKTEISTLNGCIVRLAGEKGIQVPGHRMICQLIRSIEQMF